MMTNDERIARLLNAAFLVLLFAFTLSFFARAHWFFELFNSFYLQYAIGGILIGAGLAWIGSSARVLLCLLISILSLYQVQNAYDVVPAAHGVSPNFTIASFNKLKKNRRYNDIKTWMREQRALDVLVFSEMPSWGFSEFNDIGNAFPFRHPIKRFGDSDLMVFSKTPILNPTFFMAGGYEALRFEIKKRGAGAVTIYAVHTHTPLGSENFKHRQGRLFDIAERIAEDSSQNIIFLGDWNITPYSPHFKDLMAQSGLKNEITSLFPVQSWPSGFIFPLLQIQIDHIVHKGHLRLIDRARGPSLGSDHYPVIASFHLSAHD